MDYYTLDRLDVAKALNISTRTLDRYVAKNIFSTSKKNGKIFFHEREIEDFLRERNTESIDISVDTQTDRLRHIQNGFHKHFYEEDQGNFVAKDMSKEISSSVSLEQQNRIKALEIEVETYKQMQKKTQELFALHIERLQSAYIRIGELENQSKNMVPLLESRSQQDDIKKELSASYAQLKAIEQEKLLLERQSKRDQLFKAFYFTTTLLAVIGISFFFALS